MSSLLVALLFLPLPQSSPSAFIARVSETYGRMKDFSAEFVQISQDFSNQTRQSRGHVYLKSERKARFEYESPVKKLEISDGKTFTIFEPVIGQARQWPISKVDSERFVVLQIVGNRESPWKDQFERYESGREKPLIPGNVVVVMTPRNKDLREVRVEVDPKTYWIHSLAFTYASGDRSEFRFTDIKTTPRDESFFKFVQPPGVELVTD